MEEKRLMFGNRKFLIGMAGLIIIAVCVCSMLYIFNQRKTRGTNIQMMLEGENSTQTVLELYLEQKEELQLSGNLSCEGTANIYLKDDMGQVVSEQVFTQGNKHTANIDLTGLEGKYTLWLVNQETGKKAELLLHSDIYVPIVSN